MSKEQEKLKAWEVFNKAATPASDAYMKATEALRQMCEEAQTAIWKVYDKAITPSRTVYEETMAALKESTNDQEK